MIKKIVPIVLILFVSCEIDDPEYIEEVTVEYVDEELIEIDNDFEKLIESLDVRGTLNFASKFPLFEFYQRVDRTALHSDTLKIYSDYSRWDYPDSIEDIDLLHRFEWKMALKDIDSSNYVVDASVNAIFMRIYGKDSNQVNWSKYQLSEDKWYLNFCVKSDYMVVKFLTSTSVINENFLNFV